MVISCIAGVAIGYAGINARGTSRRRLPSGQQCQQVRCHLHRHGFQTPFPQVVLGCVVAITGGVFYALARNRLADKAKAQQAALKKQQDAAA